MEGKSLQDVRDAGSSRVETKQVYIVTDLMLVFQGVCDQHIASYVSYG